jgi:hypothetical protein
MKKIIFILMLSSIGIAGYSQCTGLPASGTTKAKVFKSCYDTVVAHSQLNDVTMDTARANKVTIGLLEMTGNITDNGGTISIDPVNGDLYNNSGTNITVAYRSSTLFDSGLPILGWADANLNGLQLSNLGASYTAFIKNTNLTGNINLGLPTTSGTIQNENNTATLTNKTWNGAVIGSIYGGAGTVSGILKANGSGTVSAAVAGTDYQAALTNPVTGTGAANRPALWSGTTSQTSDPDFTYSGDSLGVKTLFLNTNDLGLAGIETGGTKRNMLRMNSANTIIIGASSVGTQVTGTSLLQAASSYIEYRSTSGTNLSRYFSGTTGNMTFGGTTDLGAFVGIVAPTTAKSQINLAPSSAVNPSSPNNGDVWNNGTDIRLRQGGTTYILAKTLTNTATLDFGSTVSGAATDLTITVTGAASGDACTVGAPNGSVPDNGVFSCWVSAADTVTVRFINPDQLAAKDPGSGTFRVSVIKY